MLYRSLISRGIILGFMVLVGYSIAKSLQAGSTLGLILAIVSLCAGVCFVYLLKQLSDQEREKAT